jgi:hypothetical protein
MIFMSLGDRQEAIMSPLRLQALAILLALPLLGFTAESPTTYLSTEVVSLTTADRDALLEAPLTGMNQPPSVELSEAINAGTIESIKVDKITFKVTEKFVEQLGRNTINSYQGWIRYTPVVVSDTRLFRPVVICTSQGDKIFWDICQDESWIRFQTDRMDKAIFFNGDLTDQHVSAIYDLVDSAGLVSTTDDQLVTSDQIYQIIKYPHAGNRVNVYVRTEKEGLTDVIYLAQMTNEEGQSEFEISEYRCGGE